jgi:hypothetical protein
MDGEVVPFMVKLSEAERNENPHTQRENSVVFLFHTEQDNELTLSETKHCTEPVHVNVSTCTWVGRYGAKDRTWDHK